MPVKFWSDTHFGHANVITYCKRPYATVDQMREGLVERWNFAVQDGDEVFFLGDFAFGSRAQMESIFARLRGNKHLVRGNHDRRNRDVFKLPWASQEDLHVVREDGARVVACHYPLEAWEGAHKGYLHAHGHSHGTLKRQLPRRYDVGVDVWAYPVAMSHLVQRARTEEFQPQDHHGEGRTE